MRLAGILIAALSANAAAAQQFEREEDQRGIRIGVWRFEPIVAAEMRFDDNIFREETNGTSSAILTISPSATLRSDWRRHSVSVQLEARKGVFLSSSADDFLDGALRLEGVIDATRASRLRIRADLAREHEARGGDDNPAGLAEPVELTSAGVELTGQYAPGRLRAQPSLSWSRLDFDDAPGIGGGFLDQDDRDRRTLRAGLLIGWRWTRKTELFLDASVARIDFDDAVDRSGADRDNRAFRALVGARLGFSDLIEGSVAAGIAARDYDDPRLSGFAGPVAEIGLTWRPTRLIELRGALSRQLEETTIADAAGAEVISAGLDGRWAIRRLIDLTAAAGFENRRFRGAGRTDRTFSFGLGAEWRATRGATLILGARHVRERSDAVGEDHSSNQIWAGARYRF